VRCDAQRPTCGNCAKTRRQCQGYGIQLSWPRDGDIKRAVVLRDMDARRRRQRGGDPDPDLVPVRARFVNVRSWDVALALAVELENDMAPGKYSRQHTGTVSYCLSAGLDGYASRLLTIVSCSSPYALHVHVHVHVHRTAPPNPSTARRHG
jgi:hypothetical protein